MHLDVLSQQLGNFQVAHSCNNWVRGPHVQLAYNVIRNYYPIITRMCHLKVSQLLGEDIKMHTYMPLERPLKAFQLYVFTCPLKLPSSFTPCILQPR